MGRQRAILERRLSRLPQVRAWPSAEEVAQSRWFSPIRYGPVRAERRTWIPAMVPWRATEDGEVSDAVVAWYRRFAQGRPGVLVVEATGIRDIPSGPLLRIGDDRYVEGLKRIVAAVREASGGHTRLFIQLIDFLPIRRRPDKERFFRRYLVLDDGIRRRAAAELGMVAEGLGAAGDEALREVLVQAPEEALERILEPRDLESYRMGYRERVTDVHLDRIRDLPLQLPGLFADAAARALEAGFDGIELHYAHAYTMASFLSATNTRADGWGGSREGRARLPLEVFREVRGRVGNRMAVGCRFLGHEVIEGGSDLDDAVWFGTRFAEAGFDFLSVSKGGKFEDARQPKVGQAAYPYTGPSGLECMPTVDIDERGPFARNLPLAASIRRAVRAAGQETPVIACGGIATFEAAERALAEGEADAVASARQSLADPDWYEKLLAGRGGEIRRCFFTNYCEALDQAHKEVTCQRWDRIDVPGEGAVARSKDGRRRLVAPPWDRDAPGTREKETTR